jgi:hypothetical protein
MIVKSQEAYDNGPQKRRRTREPSPSPQHKFKIGQLVHYHPKKNARFSARGFAVALSNYPAFFTCDRGWRISIRNQKHA